MKCKFCHKKLIKDKWGRQHKIYCGIKCMINWIRTPKGRKEWKRVQFINIPYLKKRIGKDNPNWKPANKRKSYFMPTGYKIIPVDNHPFYPKGRRSILEHRFILENYLRENNPNHPALVEINNIKYLAPSWIVHHKNGDKSDNRIENLEILYHTKHHYGYKFICPHCKKEIIT